MLLVVGKFEEEREEEGFQRIRRKDRKRKKGGTVWIWNLQIGGEWKRHFGIWKNSKGTVAGTGHILKKERRESEYAEVQREVVLQKFQDSSNL